MHKGHSVKFGFGYLVDNAENVEIIVSNDSLDWVMQAEVARDIVRLCRRFCQAELIVSWSNSFIERTLRLSGHRTLNETRQRCVSLYTAE